VTAESVVPTAEVVATNVPAVEQTLSFPIASDLGTLDPARMVVEPDFLVGQNLYNGLYRLDKNQKIVPDIASALPEVSEDGLTHVMKLRTDVVFSNGKPVTSKDVLYTWNRAAAKQDPYAFIFENVVGYDKVASGESKTLSGLEAPDDYTVVAKLTQPAPYFTTELTLWSSWIVDQATIEKLGEDTWWTTPEGLVGTGPFKMVTRKPNQLYEFEPVAGWWGGSTGTLTKVRIEVIPDQTSQIAKYESGDLDLVGYAFNSITPEDAIRFKSDPKLSSQLHIEGYWLTVELGFNHKKGPFAGDGGLPGRRALSLAIDREQMVQVSCAQGVLCGPATGGLIAPGHNGYLGDGADINAKFNPTEAKALLEQWDPDHSKLSEVSLNYPAGNPVYQRVFENLQAQWTDNLGITLKLDPVERATYSEQRSKQNYFLFQNGWGADFDHPQNWFSSSWTCTAPANRTGYCNPEFDALAKQADMLLIDQALPLYKQMGMMLVDDVAFAPLYYLTRQFIIQPYVQGAGSRGGVWENRWTEISITKP
jgi:oligopeptide transport system substrate-binding protein